MADWLPGADRSAPGNSAGSYTDRGEPKVVLHTTEGGTAAGAVGAYRKNNSWPHLTVDVKRRTFLQHLPLSVAARSLRQSSGVQTNRDNVVQIELVGRAAETQDWALEDLQWFGATVLGPILRERGIPSNALRFYGANEGVVLATARSPIRLSAAAYDAFSGILGHQHVPGNTHWDPGKFPIDKALAAVGGAATIVSAAVVSTPTGTGELVVDGDLGPRTIRKWQAVMGTFQDGVISTPKSSLVLAVQRHLNAHGASPKLVLDGSGIFQDGKPYKTVKALQKYLGTPADGILDKGDSGAVRALQRRLNEDRF